MNVYNVYLRVVVGAAVASVVLFTRGYHGIFETFVVGACAILAGHGTAYGVRTLAGPDATRRTLAILGVVVTAVAASAVFVAMDRSWPRGPTRYVRVDEVTDRFVGDEVKLHGYVEIGSLRQRLVDGDVERTFTLTEQKHSIAVRVRGSVPDTLQERAEVVARGTLRREASGVVLVATEVMAKCPSTYNTADGPKPAAQFR